MAQGLLLSLTVEQLTEIRDSAVASITTGLVNISYSVGGRSVTKAFPGLTPAEVLDEANYALRIKDPETYGYRVTRTVARFS